jgi:NADPH2 dehydrogenase
MTIDEIKEYLQLFAAAASNAAHKAGFDGVEVHSANGCLPEQFLWDIVNECTDKYGGSLENHARAGSCVQGILVNDICCCAIILYA